MQAMKMSIPQTIRAAQAKDYGPIDEMINVEDAVNTPRLSDLPVKKRKNLMMIQTKAVALAPGDCRVLSGKTRLFQGPSSFPYILGGDCCGVLVELPENAPKDLPFKVGDRVAARFATIGPRDALAEYAVILSTIACKIPDNISFEEAAALASASPATELADKIGPTGRVLVLGAGGGIGAHLCQLLRNQGASFIVGVSKHPDFLLGKPISCDVAIDYTKDDVFSMEEFKANKFDTIIDLAGYGYAKLEADAANKRPLICKTGVEGGRFITTVPPAGPIFEMRGLLDMWTVFIWPLLWKTVKSHLFTKRSLPTYKFGAGLTDDNACITKTFDLASSGKLKAVMDPRGPFTFTTQGVRDAFKLLESRHPQGKVVIRVGEK